MWSAIVRALRFHSLPIFLVACSLSLGAQALALGEPRTAKVAGAFYPAQPDALRETITQLLGRHPATDAAQGAPRALIIPHAGYKYSGIVAARGFRAVQGRTYDGVVVVGFTHRQRFAGTSVDDHEVYQTPLGTIPVDTEAVAFLRNQPGLTHHEDAHASDEHSLEVMLPFLQVALGDFRLIPLLMGDDSPTDAQALASALSALAARGNYLLIFSTDLSHYHPADQARKLDELTVNAILFETPQAVSRLFASGTLEACGRGPILASLIVSTQMGYLQRGLLQYANSGDTTGEPERVVGYAAIGMYEPLAPAGQALISQVAGTALVAAARNALILKLDPTRALEQVDLAAHPELGRARGVFVTIRRKTGQLRGCIGRIETDVPLAQLLPTVALDAALHDTRFMPLRADELDEVSLEVSVLSSPRAIGSVQEIVAGRDGVILQKDQHSGVFLPQVWEETGWTRVEFLRELAHQKAGLDPDAWQSAQLSTFQDQAFAESDFPTSPFHNPSSR